MTTRHNDITRSALWRTISFEDRLAIIAILKAEADEVARNFNNLTTEGN